MRRPKTHTVRILVGEPIAVTKVWQWYLYPAIERDDAFTKYWRAYKQRAAKLRHCPQQEIGSNLPAGILTWVIEREIDPLPARVGFLKTYTKGAAQRGFAQRYVDISFRSSAHALMFKLAWGGAIQ